MSNLFMILMLLSLVAFVIGLVNPKIVKQSTRKRSSIFFGILTICFFILFGVFLPPTNSLINKDNIEQPKVESQKTNSTTTQVLDDSKIKQTTSNSEKPKQEQTYSPTLGEKQALLSAKKYLNYTGFSRKGLIKQLEFEGFTNQEAIYGVDNSNADWNTQAAISAKKYIEYTSFSRSGLIQQLEFEGYTQQQAEYGANAVGY